MKPWIVFIFCFSLSAYPSDESAPQADWSALIPPFSESCAHALNAWSSSQPPADGISIPQWIHQIEEQVTELQKRQAKTFGKRIWSMLFSEENVQGKIDSLESFKQLLLELNQRGQQTISLSLYEAAFRTEVNTPTQSDLLQAITGERIEEIQKWVNELYGEEVEKSFVEGVSKIIATQTKLSPQKTFEELARFKQAFQKTWSEHPAPVVRKALLRFLQGRAAYATSIKIDLDRFQTETDGLVVAVKTLRNGSQLDLLPEHIVILVWMGIAFDKTHEQIVKDLVVLKTSRVHSKEFSKPFSEHPNRMGILLITLLTQYKTNTDCSVADYFSVRHRLSMNTPFPLDSLDLSAVVLESYSKTYEIPIDNLRNTAFELWKIDREGRQGEDPFIDLPFYHWIPVAAFMYEHGMTPYSLIGALRVAKFYASTHDTVFNFLDAVYLGLNEAPIQENALIKVRTTNAVHIRQAMLNPLFRFTDPMGAIIFQSHLEP